MIHELIKVCKVFWNSQPASQPALSEPEGMVTMKTPASRADRTDDTFQVLSKS